MWRRRDIFKIYDCFLLIHQSGKTNKSEEGLQKKFLAHCRQEIRVYLKHNYFAENIDGGLSSDTA